MAKEDIEKHQFKPGQSGNPKGRPKKFVGEVLAELEEYGAEKMTRQQIVAIYETMISLTEEQLKAIEKDRTKQYIFRIIAKGILSKKGFDIIERMLDRVHGKPTQTQKVDATSQLLVDGLNIVIPDPSEEIKAKFEGSEFDDD